MEKTTIQSRYLNIFSSTVAVSIATVVLFIIDFTSRKDLKENYFNLATEFSDIKLHGVSTIEEAANDETSVLMLGSSELIPDVKHKGVHFFSSKRYGFRLFPIGKAGTTTFSYIQKLGCIHDIKNKSIVISLSPNFFFNKTVNRNYIIGNSSCDQIRALLLSDCSIEFKRKFIKRLESFPEIYKHDYTLKTILYCLNENIILYYILYPYFQLKQIISNSQDVVETATILDRVHPVKHIINQAEKIAQRKPKTSVNPKQDKEFLDSVSNSEEWKDLELLLEFLKEKQADPLVLSMPVHGDVLSEQGLSPKAIEEYGKTFNKIVSKFNIKHHYFKEQENDYEFFLDNGDHLNSRGWLYYNKEIIEYHRKRTGKD